MTVAWKGGLIVVVAAVIAGVAWTQDRASKRLGREVMEARTRKADVARLRDENRRLKEAQISDAELERLRSDRAAVEQLRRELERLKGSVARRSVAREKRATASSSPVPATPPAAELGLRITERMVPPSAWRNAGRATPAAALETLLWAAAGGDVGAVANGLILEGEARTRAEALYARLPEEERQRYESAENLVALLTAKEVPLVDAQIAGPWESSSPARISLHLREKPEGPPRMALFQVRDEGGEWKLIVPASAVEKYMKALERPKDVVELSPMEAR